MQFSVYTPAEHEYQVKRLLGVLELDPNWVGFVGSVLCRVMGVVFINVETFQLTVLFVDELYRRGSLARELLSKARLRFPQMTTLLTNQDHTNAFREAGFRVEQRHGKHEWVCFQG